MSGNQVPFAISGLIVEILFALACAKSAPERTGDAQTISAGTAVGSGNAVPTPDAWRAADSATLRLSPSAFRELPANIVQALLARGCTVPQLWGEGPKPHNVIRGEFARRGQVDWAVLCSRNRASTLLVFWRASADSVAEHATAADLDYLQGAGNDQIGFSRRIGVVEREYILGNYREYGGPEPPPIDHDGIEDAFDGKVSVIYYYHNGEWLALTGAD